MSANTRAVAASNVEDIYALSPMQEAILFESLYAPGASGYFEHSNYLIEADLDVAAFGRAWQAISERHSVFRTSFVWEHVSRPVQVVHRRARMPVRLVDLREQPEHRQERTISALLAQDRRSGFDLAAVPLSRLTVVRLAPDRYRIVWSHHHILCDGWSAMLVLKEVLASYHRYQTHDEAQWVPAPRYRDYIAWLQAQDAAEAQTFWRAALAGFGEPTPLPLRGLRRDGAGEAFVETRLDETLRALHRYVRANRITFSTIVQGCWGLLLGRYAGRTDAVFGVTTSIRPPSLEGIERMVGLLVNTIPMRVSWRPGESLTGWFQRLQGEQSEARQFAYVSAADIQAWSDTPRGRKLFDSVFVFDNYPADVFERSYGGPAREEVALPIQRLPGFGSTQVPLLLTASSRTDRPLRLTYTRAGFSRETAGRILADLRRLLESVASGAVETPSRLRLVAGEEPSAAIGPRHAVDAAAIDSIAGRIARHAVERPSAVAIRAGDATLDYAALNARANQLGRYLQGLGVGPDTRVGVYVDRSIDLVVALVGVWKAGGAYVPLDVEAPAARVAALTQDAELSVVITRRDLAGRLPAPWAMVVEIDGPDVCATSAADVAGAVVGEQLAYVLYTSGSTGRPKGVMVTHAGLNNYVTWALAAYDAATLETAPLHTSVCFDLCVTSLFVPLAAGRTVDVVGVAETLEGLAARLVSGPPSLVKLTPGHLRGLRELLTARGQRSRRATLVVGGEALTWDDVAGWVGEPGLQVVNEYGPTETVVGCCVAKVTGRGESAAAVPIGRPIANTALYVVDEANELVPAGAAGELLVGGAGVARGYVGRPDATAERFVPDPWGPPGARAYRSGDRVRMREDGQLEYLGRLDAQVKLRGYRVEPAEVEHMLRAYPGAAESAVVVRDTAASPQLIGYVSARAGIALDEDELRRWMSERLPEHMVPARIVVLAQLPLTANGKLDRQALTAPPPRGAPADAHPLTASEELLAGIWTQLLQREDIGPESDFFELGGHSLLATRLVSRVLSVFGVGVDLPVVFQQPRLRALAAAIERAGRVASDGAPEPPVVTVDRSRPLPLSFAQQRLWVLDELAPGDPTYNVPLAVRLDGPLIVKAVAASLRAIVARHEVLRACFIVNENGEPRQQFLGDVNLPVPVVDVSGVPAAARERLAERVARDEARYAFDLRRGPLLRGRVVRLERDSHVLLVTMHHAASDGWSVGLLLHEFAVLYQAACRGERAKLPELPVQYADYACWQRQWLTAERLDRQLQYWRRQLAGVPDLELPLDRPRGLAVKRRGARVRFRWSPDLSDTLRRFGRAHGATLFMTILAALQALLSRYAGQTDIVVGTDVANRHRLVTEGLVGFFVNQLALRTSLAGNPTFRELVGRVRETALGAYAHQDLPFERLVEELSPARDLHRTPLFQVKFVVNEGTVGDAVIPGLRYVGVQSAPLPAKFDLSLFVSNRPDAIAGTFEYDPDLFDEGTIDGLARHLQALLQAAIAEPDQPLARVCLASEDDRREIATFNDTGIEYGRRHLLHALFEEQVRRTPHAVAVITPAGTEVTYDVLDRRANQLARFLRQQGVGPEARVAVCLDRSLELVTALFGILKAGGAYLPLDPTCPTERLAWMTQNSAVALMLTQAPYDHRFPSFQGRVIDLGTEAASLALEPDGPPDVLVHPDNGCYVIYTSGSTGRPKGVVNTHRGVCNRLLWAQATYGLTADDRVLQKTSIGFDVSVWEFFWPLMTGATLVLAEPERHRDAAYVSDAISQRGITTIHFVPPMLDTFLVAADARGCSTLRRVICSGEALGRSSVRNFHETFTCGLHNLYGPTEAAVDVTSWECRRDGDQGTTTASVPIGRPVANTQIHVLDSNLLRVPIGVPGELFIAGVQLARGYDGRTDLTAERFLPNPYASTAGERMYRTGDLARWKADGHLEYLGRLDDQIKIRGYRIELGEIEGVLLRHAGIQRARVIASGGTSIERRLVAYVVPSRETTLDVGGVRRWLEQRLPAYMVPARVIVLADLPLTSNGKVDRRALPDPDSEEGPVVHRSLTESEELLAGIWAQLLHRNNFGPESDFFDVGGHSLLATQAVSRIRGVFGVELPLSVAFQHPQLHQLAGAIDRAAQETEDKIPEPPIVRVDRSRPVPLSYAQQRMWMLDQLAPGNPTYNVPLAVRIEGALNVGAVCSSVHALVARHEMLRVSIVVDASGEPRQQFGSGVAPVIGLVDVSGMPAPARETMAQRLANEEALRPFDLRRGPLLRTHVVRLATDTHLLLATMHHVASDAWSMRLLLQDFVVLYRTASRGEPAMLPELPVEYADYASWQRRWLTGEVLDRHLQYWTRQLAGAPELELPLDRPRGRIPGRRGARVRFTWSPEFSLALRRCGRAHGATLFMSVLAGLQALLSRYSGQTDIVVGTDVANRHRLVTEGLVGFFVNQLALRTSVAGDATFRELMGRVRETALGAYAHQELPFERIVEELAPPRDPHRTALFNVHLSVTTAARTHLYDLPDVRVATMERDDVSSKWDLAVAVLDAGSSLTGSFAYDAHLFDERTIVRFADRFEAMMRALVHDPEQRISAVPLTLADEADGGRMAFAADLDELASAFSGTATPATALS